MSRPNEPLADVQRTAAYAVVTHPSGALLLVRASGRSDLAGSWALPGGGVDHGEHPQDAVVREVAEETGLAVVVTGVRAAVSDVIELPHRGVRAHTVRILYDAVPRHPAAVREALRAEPDGTSDRAAFVAPAQAARLRLLPYAADVLGLPAAPPRVTVPERPEPLGGDTTLARPAAARLPDPAELAAAPVVPARRQRPAAYAVVRDGDRVLLTHLTGSETDGPDTGMWTLPGGGIDHGEQPSAALRREVHEETGLDCTPGPLADVSSVHFTGTAPDGRLEDFHAIRLVHGARLAPGSAGREPRVVEVDGSTDRAAWVPVAELDGLRLSDVVRIGLRAVPG